jgi:hypothetical protein
MMISIGATIGESAITSDAIRAYLNAEVLDPNLVVIASPYMKAIPPKGLLNKGLYGTLKGALGWEVWIDKRIIGEWNSRNAASLGVCMSRLKTKQLHGCIDTLMTSECHRKILKE